MAVARDATCRTRELEEEVQRQRATIEALERQVVGLGHAPATETEQARSGSAEVNNTHSNRTPDRDSSATKIHKIKGGGGARAVAQHVALGAGADLGGMASSKPRESLIGKLARLSVPNWKRRADGSWGEGEKTPAKRQRVVGGGALGEGVGGGLGDRS